MRIELVVGLLAALPALIVLSIFGPVEPLDSSGYMSFAEQIITGTVPSGGGLLTEAPAPVSLLRTPGYPALIVAFQLLFGSGWKVALILLQIAAGSLLAVAAYRTAALLGLGRPLALLAALLPSVGLGLVMQVSILTDAIYSLLFAYAALVLVQAALRPSPRAPLQVGLLLAAAMLLREATLFIAVGFIPAIWIAAGVGRRVRWLCVSLLPVLAVTAGLMAANFARSGFPVVTTTPQIVLLQALLPLHEQGLPIFSDDTLYDRTARETLRGNDYHRIKELNRRLFLAGMSAPELASEARRRYLRAWTRFPVAMARATLARYRDHFLALPFHPLNAVRFLLVYAGHPRPVITNPGMLWKDAGRGDVGALLWLALLGVTRAFGTLVGLLSLASPLLLLRYGDRRTLPMLGTWLICAGCLAVYLPVHLDDRYLVPLIPLQCLLAATAWHAYRSPRQHPGIHLSTRADARGRVDAGRKARHDRGL